MEFVILIAALFALWLSYVIVRRIRRNQRRKHLLTLPPEPDWLGILEKNVPLYERLPESLQQQLTGLMHLFLAEKTVVGCQGQEITEEIKVTIAAQACILLLNRPTRYYPKLQTIYVYPSTYVAPDRHGNAQERLGESWQNGPVVLAWNSVTGGAVNLNDGRNVVFHEFAHRLDQEDGVADGAPILESRSCYTTWAQVLGNEYDRLQQRTRKYRKSVIRRYGASHPAEFFAVATEAFLEKPKQMQRKHPELYDELKSYYRFDPLEWK